MNNHTHRPSVCAHPQAVKNLFSLSTRIGALLIGLTLSTLAAIAPALAATIIVGNAGDHPIGNATNCNVASTCTLRDAIAKADNATGTTAGDTIVFSLPANSTLTLNGSGLSVDRNLTIDGSNSPNLAISGNYQSRVFEISNGNPWIIDAAITVAVKRLTIKNGNADNGGGIAVSTGSTITLIDSTVSGNTATSGSGGGIINDGKLMLTGSTVYGNTTVGTFGKGGGIYNNNNGALTIINSTVSNNEVNSHGDGGGGIYNYNGSMTLINSTVSGNIANGYGGGIYNGGISTLANSTVSDNTANGNIHSGGGVSNFGTMMLTSSTISGNTVTSGGGGGIHNGYGYPTALTLIDTTVSGNTANYGSGGIDNYSDLTLIHSTLAANTISGGAHSDIWNYDFNNATALSVNTIIQSCAVVVNTTHPPADNGGNLDGGNGCGFTSASSKSNATLDLGALADNGGPTLTMLPGVNSDAIGFGRSDVCRNAPVNSRDQRGYVRPSVGCTSGAVDPNASANDSIFYDGFALGGW